MKIRAVLTSYNSKRDRFGNCYWAFCWTSTATGRKATGQICGGESNIQNIIRAMGLESAQIVYTNVEMGVREFERFTKGLPYAGCTPEELALFIKAELKLAKIAVK
jgi:hypothetical protein